MKGAENQFELYSNYNHFSNVFYDNRSSLITKLETTNKKACKKENHFMDLIHKENLKRVKSESRIEKGFKAQLEYKINKSTRCKIIEYFQKLINVNNFTQDCFYLSCYYLDYLSYVSEIKTLNIGLYSIGCFILASKFHETDPCMPSLRAFKKTGGLHYDPEDVKKYEIMILKHLGYKLNYITSYDIIKFVMNYGVIVEAKFLKDYSPYMKEFIKEYFTLSFFLLEELISEFEIVKFSQLQIACACLMMAKFFKCQFIEIDVLLFENLKFNSDEMLYVFNELKIVLSEKYNQIIKSNCLFDNNQKMHGAYEEYKSNATYQEFIKLLDYNLIGKTTHIKEQLSKIKEFKILNLKQNTSSNSITLRLSLNQKIEIEPKTFDSSNRIEGLKFKKANNNSNTIANPNEEYYYEPMITASDFSSIKENLTKIDYGLTTTTTTNYYDPQSYDNYYSNNQIQIKNLQENKTKYGFDNYYRENSVKNSNDGLLNKPYSSNKY